MKAALPIGRGICPRRPRRVEERGMSLIATAAFITVLSTAVAVGFLATTRTARSAARTKTLEAAVAVGDAYTEYAFAQWRSICRTQNNTPLPSSNFTTIAAPAGSFLPQPSGYTVANFSVVATDVEGKAIGSTTTPPPAQGEDTGDKAYFYKASADVTVPTFNSKPVVAKVRRTFEKHVESPWRYAIFYNDILEIHPSPTFTVNGWVHTNGSLYSSPDGGNPLNYQDRVTYSGTYFQGYAPGDYVWRGRSGPDGAANTFAAGQPPSIEPRKDPFGMSPDQFATGDSNPNNDGYRELIERPTAGYTDPLTDSSGANPRLYNFAGVKVLVDASNALTVMKTDGTVLSGSTGSPADRATYNAVVAAISTNVSIQDYREASTVRLVTLDVSKLATASIASWNGGIYISDTSASQTGGSPKRGVRIKNGATLPSGGLTVASDNPIYIQGDYNTLGTRQPAAVIGDAVMFLSNNWKDANSSADINSGNRTATTTTINTAILAGNVPTDASLSPSNTAYSGGVENFPRFMENWSGVTINYNGSMVQLFQSKQAIGRWGSSSQTYSAPVRNWAFDPIFRTTPPPGTLFTTTYIKQRWYLE
jgi:hypothetical protein